MSKICHTTTSIIKILKEEERKMIVETQNSVYKVTGDENIKKIEKIEEKNAEYSVIRVGWKDLGKVTIKIPGIMEILSEDRRFTCTSEIKNIRGRIRDKREKNEIVIKNNEIVFYNIKFEVEEIMINSRGCITALQKGKLLDFGDII